MKRSSIVGYVIIGMILGVGIIIASYMAWIWSQVRDLD